MPPKVSACKKPAAKVVRKKPAIAVVRKKPATKASAYKKPATGDDQRYGWQRDAQRYGCTDDSSDSEVRAEVCRASDIGRFLNGMKESRVAAAWVCALESGALRLSSPLAPTRPWHIGRQPLAGCAP